MSGAMNFARARDRLKAFAFQKMFIDDLGWHSPEAGTAPLRLPPTETSAWTGRVIAQLEGFAVIELASDNGSLPTAADERKRIHGNIRKEHHEHLLIFTDQQKEKCLWSWVKDRRRNVLRDHYYFKGQSGDLFLSKLATIFFEFTDLDDEGNIKQGILEVVKRVTDAMDVENVTRKFFDEYKDLRKDTIMAAIGGIENDADRKKYATLLLNRLMFIWFLQKKGFVDNQDTNYLRTKYDEIACKGGDNYYRDFLQPLFFEGLAKPEKTRSSAVNKQIGQVPYMNGGLFTHSAVERNNSISVDNRALGDFLVLLGQYQWHLDDTPGGADNTINPTVLGYIFEKQINDKQFGAYYTRPEITGYLCERTIHQAIYDRLGKAETKKHETFNDVLANLTVPAAKKLIKDILPRLSILDPACGSGAFLIEAAKTVADVYFAVIDVLKAADKEFLDEALPEYRNEYKVRRKVITQNIYGVDVMDEAVEICRLRLFLALVSTTTEKSKPEPLPNIDFNIMAGNSLIGLQRVSEDDIKKNEQHDLLVEGYSSTLKRYKKEKKSYQEDGNSPEKLENMKMKLDELRRSTYGQLNEILMRQFHEKNIKYERQTWDEEKCDLGSKESAPLAAEHISRLLPFHWGFEFDEILNQPERDGFDVIIANPPWETFKPNAKEFFQQYSKAAVSKKSMTVKDFDKKKKEMLSDADNLELRAAWLDYLSSFPHQSNWFRKSGVYKHQSATVKDFRTGKERKTGTDINLYKLFVEKSHSLLADGGQCGIVVPSGIYTDSGAKGLRKMLFAKSRVSGLFCFENRKRIFEKVDSRFKFVVLTFAKGGRTEDFPAEFMRHDVRELEFFPNSSSNRIEVENSALVSPETLAITEIKGGSDMSIIEKMLRFPLLGDKLPGTWSVQFKREFDMTGDSNLFRQARELGESGFVRDGETWVKGREKYLPLYEGKMIHQFTHKWERSEAMPKYWINEQDGKVRYENRPGQQETLAYQMPQLAFRNVARSTDERSMIMSFLPAGVFAGNSLGYAYIDCEDREEYLKHQLWLCAFANSFAFDYLLRMKISANLNFMFIYQIPVPRSIPDNEIADRILARAAQLVHADSKTGEFNHVGKLGFALKSDLSLAEQTRIKAEIDALIAHVYELSEKEYTYLLNSFPLVRSKIKSACQNAYRDQKLGLLK